MNHSRSIHTLSLVLLLLIACEQPAPPKAQAREPAPPKATEASEPPVYRTFRAPSMGTTIEVVVPDSAEASAHARAVFDTFERVDARMSEWKDTSPLSAVNASPGVAVAVPADLRAVLRRGIAIGQMTRGAFDITWASLWGLWDFRAKAPVVPSPEAIAARIAFIDYRKVEVDDEAGTVKLADKGMKLGLGGIAKGYALDQAADALRSRGASSFLISAGGQVYAVGERAGSPWKVGIRDPRGARDDNFATLSVPSGTSVATSGDYESFFIIDGVRYHHILDPRTGMPTRELRSVTVISSDATLADALSTAAMVMGEEPGLALITETPNAEAIIVDSDGEVHVTKGIAGALHTRHPPRPDK